MTRWLRGLMVLLAPLGATACNDLTVEEVPEDVCLSGKRWIGGKRGSPNMYPGRDCVGCHRDNDGPELIFGGTLYGFVEALETRGQFQSGEDCFGVGEGFTVTLTAADGQVFEAETNEAGNFFVEGKQSDVVMPFRVEIDWVTPDGQPADADMARRPSYGGCGRCHNPALDRSADVIPQPPEPGAEPEEVAPEDVLQPVTTIGLRGIVYREGERLADNLAEYFGDDDSASP